MGISAPRLFEPYPLASALLYGAALAVTSKAVHEYVLKRRLPGSFWVAISAVALAAWYLIRSVGFSLSPGDVAKVLLIYALCTFLLHWLKPFLNAYSQSVGMHISFEKMRREYETKPSNVREYFNQNLFPQAPREIKITLFKKFFPEVEKLKFKTLAQGFALWEKHEWWPKADQKFQESEAFSLDDIEKVWRNIFPIWHSLEPADRGGPEWGYKDGFQSAFGVWQQRPHLFSKDPEREMEDLRNTCEQIKIVEPLQKVVHFLEGHINENHPLAKAYDKAFYQTHNVWNWTSGSSYLVYAHWKSNLDFYIQVMRRWSNRTTDEIERSYVSGWRMTKTWKQQFPSRSLKEDFYPKYILPHIVNSDRRAIEASLFAIFKTVEFFSASSYVVKLAELRVNFERNPHNIAGRYFLVTLDVLSDVLQDDPLFKKYKEIFYDTNNWGSWRNITEYFICIATKRPADAIGSRTRSQQLDDEKWSQILNRDIPLMSTAQPTGLPQEYAQIRDKLLNYCRIEELFDKPKSKTELKATFKKLALIIAHDKIARLIPTLELEANVVYTCVKDAKEILEKSSYLPQ